MSAINLFCLPFAGGSYYAYRDFERYLSGGIRPVLLDFPGHGRRLKEPLLTDLHDMADDVFSQIRAHLHEPYAIYGHSMGAMVAYLAARKVEKEKMPEPVHLFLTGRQAPSVESKEKDAYLLPKQEFIRRLGEYGGIPKEVLAEKELLDFFEPIIRADFQAIGTYLHTENGAAPLNVPITVMIGLNDTVSYQEVLKWQEITHKKITVRQFPGGHFFIFDHVADISRIISRTLWESAK